MSYCSNCGNKFNPGAKFCDRCGAPIGDGTSKRTQEFAGKIIKCPNCGEILKSFQTICPACGFELREVKATTAVKEFALKLEAIEANREYEKPIRLFGSYDSQVRIPKADEQKISLIQSFSFPFTKEDILEFMILATSNINFRAFDSANTNISKSEKAINDAWLSKIRQVYDKAKLAYQGDSDFTKIQILYDRVYAGIGKSKKKGIIKWILMFAWIPVFFVAEVYIRVNAPAAEKEEIARLTAIEQEVDDALEKKEYKRALLNAEELEYAPNVRGNDADKIERQWDIKRELLIEKIINAAEEDGVHLEYTPEVDEDSTDIGSIDNPISSFVNGFEEGLHSGGDSAEENVEE